MALFGNPEYKTLSDLFIQQLDDLYDAENRLTKALPNLAEAASSPELRGAFESHLRQTEGHVMRLISIFRRLAHEPEGDTCQAMKGLIKEGDAMISAGGDPHVRDAGLVAAAQRVEHYEMAGYGSARAFAEQLGLHDVADTLQKTLDEEKEADRILTSIALGGVNVLAGQATPQQQELQ